MWAAHKQAGKHMGKQIKQNDYWLLLAFVSEAFYDQKKKKKKWRTGEWRNSEFEYFQYYWGNETNLDIFIFSHN